MFPPQNGAAGPDRGPRASRWRLAAPLAVALVFTLALTKVTSFDTWVHLSLGRWMAEHGRVPRTNLLSHTMPERPTVDHQWLFQLGLYRLWQAAGPAGAVLAKAAVVAAAFAVVLATARTKGAGPQVACLVTLVAALAARFRFTVRPQVVAFLLFALYLLCLERWRHGARRGLLALLPLQVLWANVHGSAVLGLGLALAVAAGETVRGVLLRGRPAAPRGRPLAWLWAVALALVPLTLLNPNGARLLTLPFTHAGLQAESGLKELLQDRAAVAWAELGGRHLFFAVLAAAAVPALVAAVARRDVTELGLVLGLLLVAARAERFIGLFAVAAAPGVARELTRLVPRLTALWRPTAEGGCATPRRPGAALAATAVTMAALAAFDVHRQRQALPPGLSPHHEQLPGAELAVLSGLYLGGELFNEFEDGGYIAWRLRRAVFVDSRGLLAYHPGFMRAYVRTWAQPRRPVGESRAVLAQLLARYRMGAALVFRPRLKQLFASLGWRVASESGRHALFLPPDG